MENQTPNRPENEVTKSRPKKSGRVAGWILVVLGVLFLLNNFYILDFERFWPLVLIAIGIVLLAKRST